MRPWRVLLLDIALVGAILHAAGAGAQAPATPPGPIRMIVPFPPGGVAGLVGLTLAEKLKEALGQPVIVENKPGAGANIGTDLVAKSKPDGATLLLATNGPLVVNPSLMKDMPFDPLKDLDPITQIASIPLVLAVHAGVPARTLPELIALAKAKPGEINYASSGDGTSGHLAGALLASMAGARMSHIPYKGSNPAMADVVGGHVQMTFVGYLSTVPYIRSGKVRALAMATARRATIAPDVPAIAEFLPGFEVEAWYGLLAPAGTPAPVIARLHRETTRILKLPDVREKLFEKGGLEPIGSTPEEFAATLRRETPLYARIVRIAGAKSE